LGKIIETSCEILEVALAKLQRSLSERTPSFLQEKALVLGRLVVDTKMLFVFCTVTCTAWILPWNTATTDTNSKSSTGNDQIAATVEYIRRPSSSEEDNAYLPWFELPSSRKIRNGDGSSDPSLALRRGNIDRRSPTTASKCSSLAVARPFSYSCPSDSESQCRRLTVVSLALARYLRLKESLTAAQLKAQANLRGSTATQSNFMTLCTNQCVLCSPERQMASSTMPDVMIVATLFPRHLVIQAKSDYRI
jgi:hypothetical protein